MLWAIMPSELQPRVRPIAAEDYWGSGIKRTFARGIFNAHLVKRYKARPFTRADERVTTQTDSGSSPQRGQLAGMTDILDAGDSLIIFPEGTRGPADQVAKFHAGLYRLARHAPHRETAYQQVDPAGLARSLPGLAEVGGPALVAVMGDPARFAKGKQFRSFTGLTPKASETGDTDRKGQAMSKAGSSLLRTTMVRAADTARKQDPQLARIYYLQMVERGKDHLGALCVVAANLAERAWAVMNRGMPYVICDTSTRGDLPQPASSPAAADQVNRRTA